MPAEPTSKRRRTEEPEVGGMLGLSAFCGGGKMALRGSRRLRWEWGGHLRMGVA